MKGKFGIIFLCLVFVGMIVGGFYLWSVNSVLKKEQQSFQKEQESFKKEQEQLKKDKIAFADEVNKTKNELDNQRKIFEGTNSKPVSNVPKETVYHNEMFKDVVVSESENEFIVTGKAQVFEGVFEYALYNGNKLVLENHYQTEGAPTWGEFKISFKKELVSGNDTKLELFAYSAKDGSKLDVLEIPIIKH